MSDTFALKDILDYTVFNYSASGYGDALFTVDYAKNSNITTTAERLPIRGGGQNFKILDIDHTKDCQFISSLPIIDVNALAVKLGKAIAVGAKAVPFKEIKTVSASNTITLSKTPLANTLKVHKLANERDLGTEQLLGTPGTTEDKFSISTATITFNSTSCPEGTKIIVFYEYTSGATAQNLKITATDFPDFITITGRAIVDDDQAGSKIPVAFKVHKAKVLPNFELTMAADAATELDFTVDCYTVLNSAGEREYIDITKLNDESV
jgi:hypothetical protein